MKTVNLLSLKSVLDPAFSSLLFVSFLLFPALLQAQHLEPPNEIPNEPRYVVERVDGESFVVPEGAQGLDRLREALPQLGFRRFIVGLDIGLLPEEVHSYGDEGLSLYRSLSESAALEFRRTLDGVLNTKELRYFRPITGLPYVVIEATTAVLDAIVPMAQVRSISLESGGVPLLNQSASFIGAPTAHSALITGSGKRVAVIDTGVARTHPMLTGRISAEACFSTAAYSSIGSICQAGSFGSTITNSGGPCDDDPECRPGHGTHVASIVAGNSVSPSGGVPSLRGVAYQSQLIAIMAQSRVNNSFSICNPSFDCYRFFESDVAAALSHVLNLTPKNISAVNLSFILSPSSSAFVAGTCDATWPVIRDAVTLLTTDGIAVVAGSGNAGGTLPNRLPSPACLSKTVAVAATSKSSDNFESYSNASTELDILAPGGTVNYNYSGPDCRTSPPVATSLVGAPFFLPDGIWAAYHRPICTSAYLRDVGTSMAAPHVAATFALMEQKYPDASTTGIRDWILDSGVNVSFSQNLVPYNRPRVSISDAMVPPPAPSSGPSGVSVTNMFCFGQNIVSWSSISGTTEYHLQGSSSPVFTAPATYFRGNGLSAFINVPFDSYIRVRGCNMVSCGPWTTAGTLADYQPFCS